MSDKHPQLVITEYFVSIQGGLPGPVIQIHLTKTTEYKSSHGLTGHSCAKRRDRRSNPKQPSGDVSHHLQANPTALLEAI